MSEKHHPSRLRFNFGFFLEAPLGTSRTYELNYPTIQVDELTLTPLQGEFTAVRTSEGVYITGQLHTIQHIPCTRCLEDAVIEIDINLDDLFYYPPDTASEGEYVLGEDGYIDLGPLVRELSILGVPLHPLCRENCQGLCPQCGQNFNQGQCECEIDDIDPRLAVLKELLSEDVKS